MLVCNVFKALSAVALISLSACTATVASPEKLSANESDIVIGENDTLDILISGGRGKGRRR